MDLSYKQEVTVGGLVLVAIVLFVVGTTWLSGRSVGGNTSKYWHVQFGDVGGLKVSSAVRVSGVSVGRVEEIKLIEAGKVLVAISLADQIVPKTDAKAEVAAVGFVGDAVIDFQPGQAPEPLPKSRVIIGSAALGLTDRATALSYRADSLLVGAQAIVNQRTADQLRETLAALQGTLKAAQRTMDIYANPRQGPTAALTETMTSLRETMASFRQLSARLDSTMANPALARTLNRTDTLTAKLATMSSQFATTGARLDSLFAAVNRGQGTIGKFATDTALYYEMRHLAQSTAQLMDELMKHPGKISPTVKVCLIPGAC